MRSCALRIFDAETVSMAEVIFCVLLMLAILVRISFAPAMTKLPASCGRLPAPDGQAQRQAAGCNQFE